MKDNIRFRYEKMQGFLLLPLLKNGVMRCIRPFISFALIFFFFCSQGFTFPVYATDEMPLVINGFSAMLVDAQRGQTLYAKQEKERLHITLSSRLMTVLLSLEDAKPGAMITASSEATKVKGAMLSLRVGEKYTLENLTYAVVLSGANDASMALADYVGGTIDDFVAMMNAKAEQLGMLDTHFSNPTGIIDDAQYTTAADMAIFMKYALTNPSFSRVFSTQAKPWYDDKKTSLLTNRNTMFWSYDGTDGGIAGNSEPSLESIITTATRNNLRLICIILEVPTTSKNTDCANLLTHGFTNYRFGTLVAAGQTLKTLDIGGQPLNLLAKNDTFYVYPIGQSFVTGMVTSIDEGSIAPPILKSTSVGKAIFTLADKTVIEVDLVPEKDILPQKTTWEAIKEQLKTNQELLYFIGFLAVIEIVWILGTAINSLVRRLSRKKKQRRTL